jgi:hypothetical protein
MQALSGPQKAKLYRIGARLEAHCRSWFNSQASTG